MSSSANVSHVSYYVTSVTSNGTHLARRLYHHTGYFGSTKHNVTLVLAIKQELRQTLANLCLQFSTMVQIRRHGLKIVVLEH